MGAALSMKKISLYCNSVSLPGWFLRLQSFMLPCLDKKPPDQSVVGFLRFSFIATVLIAPSTQFQITPRPVTYRHRYHQHLSDDCALAFTPLFVFSGSGGVQVFSHVCVVCVTH